MSISCPTSQAPKTQRTSIISISCPSSRAAWTSWVSDVCHRAKTKKTSIMSISCTSACRRKPLRTNTMSMRMPCVDHNDYQLPSFVHKTQPASITRISCTRSRPRNTHGRALSASAAQALVPRGHHEHRLPKLSCRMDKLSIRCFVIESKPRGRAS